MLPHDKGDGSVKRIWGGPHSAQSHVARSSDWVAARKIHTGLPGERRGANNLF